jgi:hypothetical protein
MKPGNVWRRYARVDAGRWLLAWRAVRPCTGRRDVSVAASPSVRCSKAPGPVSYCLSISWCLISSNGISVRFHESRANRDGYG